MKWDNCSKEQLLINGHIVQVCREHGVVELSTIDTSDLYRGPSIIKQLLFHSVVGLIFWTFIVLFILWQAVAVALFYRAG